MILIHVMGGLGNQLYQYALSEKLKSLGKEVKLDFYAYKEAEGDEKEWRELELEWLEGLEYKVCTKDERTLFLDNSMKLKDRIRRKLSGRKSREVSETRAYMPEIFDMDDVYLYGFWGCDRYYTDILSLLQDKIRFPKTKNQKNVEKTKNLYFGIDFYVSMCYNPFVKETIRFMASGVKLFIQKIKDSWIWLVSFSIICLTIQESIQKNSTLRLTF